MLNLTGKRRLPVILQAETAECGLACFAMISVYHGRQEDLASLRSRGGFDHRGASVADLMRLATASGMTGRAVRCETTDIASLRLPAILHWDFDHFVVVKRAGRRNIVVHDPALGARRYTLAEAGRHFTGIVVEIVPAAGFVGEDYRRRLRIRDFFGDIRGLMPALGQLLILSSIIQGFALLSPLYLQLTVDQVLLKDDADLLIVIAAGFLGITLISVLTRALRGFANIYLTHQLAFGMGTGLFHHLLRLPVSWFSRRHMGDIVSRFGSLRPVQDFMTGSAVNVVIDGMLAVTTLVMVYVYSPLLATVLLGSLLLYLIIQVLLYFPVKLRTHESIAADARLDSNFMETIRAIGAVKRFTVEHLRESDWQNRFTDSINARIRVDRLKVWLEVINSAVTGVTQVTIVFLGAKLVLDREMTVGMLYAFLAWRGHLSDAVTSLVVEFVRFLMLSLHMERLADIRLAEPEATGPTLRPAANLTLENASFRYSARTPWIFRHCNVTLKQGESLAIFGPSGCGKSTLLNALQNLLLLDEGRLLLDGQSINEMGGATLRDFSASVMQDDGLLSGNIQSNITFNDPFPDPQRVQLAAHIACIHDDIHALPMGYDTLVGEMGVSLSAGQQQRILIARAIYRQPTLLFLDEGTAHLDRETEHRVMTGILALGITCIFTTHSKTLLPLATRILFRAGDNWAVRRPPDSRAASTRQGRPSVTV